MKDGLQINMSQTNGKYDNKKIYNILSNYQRLKVKNLLITKNNKLPGNNTNMPS